MCANAFTEARCASGRRQLLKNGVSLLELTIVMVVIAIGAAVAIPRLCASISQQRLKTAAQTGRNDVLMLRRHAIETSQELVLEFQANPALMRITPEIKLMGVTTSSVAYADDYPGLTFEMVDLDGSSVARISCRGDLTNKSTGKSLGVARVFVGGCGRKVGFSQIDMP